MITSDGTEHSKEAPTSYIIHSQHETRDAIAIEGVETLPELFRWQARRRQDAPLFSFRSQPDEGLAILSYAQAFEKSVQAANSLHKLFYKNSSWAPVVGIWLERSIDLHLSILSTTISGATWLPFDADAPASRVAVCLEDSKACVLVCDSSHYDNALQATEHISRCQVVKFEQLLQSSDTSLKELPGPCENDTAYMIYTSGSTGTPKGIEIPHRAALRFCLSERSVLETGPDDVVWQGFSAAFDMFIEEVWVSIAGGAHLAVGSRSECQDVPGLGGSAGIWAQRGVTVVNAVPTLINIMTSLDSDFPLPQSVRLLNLGGEACPPSLVNRLSSPQLRIFNTYGPSETTVTATFQELFPDESVTIGKPLPMYHAMLLPILDEKPKVWSPIPLCDGAEGELVIGGPCVGKGYVQRPSLTAEKFIAHPVHFDSGERAYRTGDHVRLDKNMNIVFLGRIDTQVKHRGFRIELGEIEQAIATHPEVQTVAVILSSTTDKLEAYIVVDEGKVIETTEFRERLRHLPAYMQPEAFYFLAAQELPRLPSGKINMKALQDTSVNYASRKHEGSNADVKPTFDATEHSSDLGVLLRAMADIFPQASDLSATSDFFDDLGGHSMVAAMLVSKLRKESPDNSPLRRLGLQCIYMHRTPEKIVHSISDSSDEMKTTTEEKIPLDNQLSDFWPVSKRNYVLCGLAQIPALLLIFFIEALSLLAPYVIFYIVLDIYDIGTAIVTTYLAFVVIPPMRAIVGICGKWVALGKAKAGEYPLYGVYYYRWWLAERFIALVDMVTIADTPLLPTIMRFMGANIGVHCHIGHMLFSAAFDLIHIGDDVNIGKDVVLSTSWVERGRLILAPVQVASDTFIGSNSVLEGGSRIEEGAELGPMSMLPQGSTIPAGERWIGSPAQFHSYPSDVGNMRASRPSEWRKNAMVMAMVFSSIFVLPIVYFAPQLPSMLLFDYVDIRGTSFWVQQAIVAAPAGIIYMVLVFVELFVFRWLILGRVKECSFRTTSTYFFRRWLVGRLMDMSLVILHPVYATLYVVPFLRSLGVKIGRRAEVSTARGINFELTEIGDESFVADLVLIGDEEVRSNMVTLKKTKLNERAFLGNASMVPQGTEMASNTLVGVLSCAPSTPLKEGESCFGSPPVLMPARQGRSEIHADHLLYKPKIWQIAMRLFIEGMRIILPRIIVVFGLAFNLAVLESFYNYLDVWPMVLVLPLFYFFLFGLPALVVTLVFKWLLIGRYRRAEWPLWSIDVWKSEFITSTYETLTGPFLTDMLRGTPFLAWTFRLFGVQIGARATILSNDITEFDMVSFGDESMINKQTGPQTHLFEDRVMKVGRVDVEARGCMKTYGVCLPNSQIEEGGQLGSLSLVMKNETVPTYEAWEGAPIAPRRSKVSKQSQISVGSISASIESKLEGV